MAKKRKSRKQIIEMFHFLNLRLAKVREKFVRFFPDQREIKRILKKKNNNNSKVAQSGGLWQPNDFAGKGMS